ncbi:protein kinase domain-containing protein [Tumidithrix elongata]|uniref:protein kinase domain-containing protein n=1 Tax=Tumidithrix elongata TaxID=3088357 RepID=UPI0038CD90CC
MSYCLNSTCNKQNPSDAKFCKHCGWRLLLRDRYRAVKKIGQGGFGKTFLAVDEDKPSKPLCVIKQFFPSNQDPSSAIKAAELFAQEALRLDALGKHAQIPELFAYFEQDKNQYLIQEFIDGQNLAEELVQEGVFSETKIWLLLNHILPVLQFIHENQVIHRDIKPENIIRRSDGQIVLVDFGAAKFAAGNGLTATGTVIGSAAYTSPEQARGKAIFGSDLYSLGVTCLHLLTGIDPFQLFDDAENDWIWRDYLTTPVSDSLGKILGRLVQPGTKKRYQSAEEVIQDIRPERYATSSHQEPTVSGSKASFPYTFRNYSSGTILLKGDMESVSKYIENHPQWLPQCILPLKARAIGANAYSLNIGKIGALGYEIDPTVNLYMTQDGRSNYQIKTQPIPAKDPNGYEVSFHSKIKLVEHPTRKPKNKTTRIEWDLTLIAKLDFPMFVMILPTSLVQRTGDAILNQVVKQVSDSFSEKISQDFHRFLKS